MNLQSMLERDEGRRLVAYPDPLTGAEPWTIGIGHTGPEVHKGLIWTDAQVDGQFNKDVEHVTTGCKESYPWFEELSEPRQAVLQAMAFQLGMGGLSKFKNMLDACKHWAFGTAADEMLNSSWARQTPGRATRMAQQMRTGLWT